MPCSDKNTKPRANSIHIYKKIMFCDEDSFQININFNAYENQEKKAAEFAVEASKKGFNTEVSIEEKIKTFKERAKEEDYIFAVYNNEIVAQAYIQAATDLVNQIGGVYTKEEYRGKGICKALVSELCKRIKKKRENTGINGEKI
ncbi:MAG: GNAT family N-acetyltransferase [Thermovenabulum sp.]|uniref:GNAT family N-acetyltransferase n=2 Tax=Thermovenabulum sp. TaxID=3100335 RepID=UPI003C7A3DFA